MSGYAVGMAINGAFNMCRSTLVAKNANPAGLRQLLFALILAAFAGSALATDATDTPAPSSPAAATLESPAPNKIALGIYITGLYDFDMAKRSFNVVFWAWFRSKNDEYKPFETLEITNARNVLNRYNYNQDVIPKEIINSELTELIKLTAAKYYVNIEQDWDTVYFPFDRQHLKIYFEDSASDNSLLQFIADTANSGISDIVHVPGWTVEEFNIRTEDSLYDTNFGNDSASVPSSYSRVVAEITVKRTGIRLMANIYAGFFVAFLLTFLTYFMDVHSMVGNRIGLCGGAIFASVGNKYIVDNTLPLTSQFTLTDAVVLSTFLAIVICIMTALAVKALVEQHETLAKVVNWTFGIISLGGYLSVIGLIIFKANA